jgi:hypothetical protein
MLDSREIGGGTTHHANLLRKQDAKQLYFQKKMQSNLPRANCNTSCSQKKIVTLVVACSILSSMQLQVDPFWH